MPTTENPDVTSQVSPAPFDEPPDAIPGRHEDPNEFFREVGLRLADVAGGVGDLHQMGLAGAVGADEDVDAGRRLEVKRFEGGEPLQLHSGDRHAPPLVRVSV